MRPASSVLVVLLLGGIAWWLAFGEISLDLLLIAPTIIVSTERRGRK